MIRVVNKSVPVMPQVAQLDGSNIQLTCRIGTTPLHTFRIPLAQWPAELNTQRELIYQHAHAQDPGFYTKEGSDVRVVERVLDAQHRAVLDLLAEISEAAPKTACH